MKKNKSKSITTKTKKTTKINNVAAQQLPKSTAKKWFTISFIFLCGVVTGSYIVDCIMQDYINNVDKMLEQMDKTQIFIDSNHENNHSIFLNHK